MGTRGRPLRFLAVWPLFGASQLRHKGVVANAREIEGTGDWRIGRPVVCYCLVKIGSIKRVGTEDHVQTERGGEALYIKLLVIR